MSTVLTRRNQERARGVMSSVYVTNFVPFAGPRLSGCEIVPGLGVNKKLYLAAGADLAFLASAMMETKRMDPKSYPLGDLDLNNKPKVKDEFNAGACKQNWGMMRQVHAWKKHGHATTKLLPQDYMICAVLNSNKSLDVTVYKECMKHFGERQFLAGHRNGTTGLANPYTADINTFIDAWKWTKERLLSDPNHLVNDLRFWVDLPRI